MSMGGAAPSAARLLGPEAEALPSAGRGPSSRRLALPPATGRPQAHVGVARALGVSPVGPEISSETQPSGATKMRLIGYLLPTVYNHGAEGCLLLGDTYQERMQIYEITTYECSLLGNLLALHPSIGFSYKEGGETPTCHYSQQIHRSHRGP